MSKKLVFEKIFTETLEILEGRNLYKAGAIAWALPILAFGNIRESTVATVGINPSNREFMDTLGRELDSTNRRFPTLSSLDLCSWKEARKNDLKLGIEACDNYFQRNPYGAWFNQLDAILNYINASYYSTHNNDACHLDLVPYATDTKWAHINSIDKEALLSASSRLIGKTIKHSKIRTLVLNGSSVVRNFEKISNAKFRKREMQSWKLARGQSSVSGYSFSGLVSRIDGVDLGRSIFVVGFNHNIQSSFGVSNSVRSAIGLWLRRVWRAENEPC